ncbi:TetR/AcrR family transcriptional regulator [Ruegeria halocynthiae]|uniref:TetR/AcrR family transcriptional regulator n=1 Tax=Ruegeria halocynthiae TaxID=985054 RepID=UPI00069183CE|nr:TetR family transcriptional regulator [Ruegeria halocynthiae]
MSYLPKSERRIAIIEATLRQVAQVGFGGLTTRGIAQELGAAPGTIHHNFASLTDLKCAALQHMADAEFARYDSLIANLPMDQALLQMLVPDSGSDTALIARVWISAADEATRSDQVGAVFAEAVNQSQSRLAAFLTAYHSRLGCNAKFSPDLLAWKLLALSTSLSDFQISGKVLINRDQILGLIQDELANSLCGDKR